MQAIFYFLSAPPIPNHKIIRLTDHLRIIILLENPKRNRKLIDTSIFSQEIHLYNLTLPCRNPLTRNIRRLTLLTINLNISTSDINILFRIIHYTKPWSKPHDTILHNTLFDNLNTLVIVKNNPTTANLLLIRSTDISLYGNIIHYSNIIIRLILIKTQATFHIRHTVNSISITFLFRNHQ